MIHFRRPEIPEIIGNPPPEYDDDRVLFSEVYKEDDFEAEGIAIDWIRTITAFPPTPAFCADPISKCRPSPCTSSRGAARRDS
jgi:hypothetical protein